MIGGCLLVYSLVARHDNACLMVVVVVLVVVAVVVVVVVKTFDYRHQMAL